MRKFILAPSWRQKRLALILGGLALAVLALIITLGGSSERVPAGGGGYTEGILGEPRFINPVLAILNEADRDLVALVFAGLTKRDEKGNVVGDLAETFSASSGGRTYKFTLRENLIWPDGAPITADDVLFTVNLVQDLRYESPLKPSWQGVRARKIDERTVEIALSVPLASFPENASLGILPKHLWENVAPHDFALSELNLKPMGAGPYKIRKISRNSNGTVSSIELDKNPTYYDPAFIDKITFRFYDSEDALLRDWRRGRLDSVGIASPYAGQNLSGGHVYELRMPRYYGVFFNDEKNAILKDRDLRVALAHATNRSEIIENISGLPAQAGGRALAQEGPLPPWELPNPNELASYEFSEDTARNLVKAGDTPPSFKLTTADIPELTQVARILLDQWEKVGFKIEIDIVPASDIQSDVIRPRNYEALLFGEALGVSSDPFSFWHSSQIKDPGLNLALYDNVTVDNLLEQARQTTDAAERRRELAEFERIVRRDLPAIFLYSPRYLYVLPKKIKGFAKEIIGTPDQRFEGINDWYIKTRGKK